MKYVVVLVAALVCSVSLALAQALETEESEKRGISAVVVKKVLDFALEKCQQYEGNADWPAFAVRGCYCLDAVMTGINTLGDEPKQEQRRWFLTPSQKERVRRFAVFVYDKVKKACKSQFAQNFELTRKACRCVVGRAY